MFFPILVDIKKVVIIGGGREWRRKVEKWSGIADEVLVATDEPFDVRDNVTVWSQVLEVSDIPRLIDGATLVISEHPDSTFTQALYETCRARNLLLNVVDNRRLSNVFATSCIDKPNLLITISTKGSCAYYSKQIRLELEEEMEHRSHISGILAEVRRGVHRRVREAALEAVYTDMQFMALANGKRYDEARNRALEVASAYPASDGSR